MPKPDEQGDDECDPHNAGFGPPCPTKNRQSRCCGQGTNRYVTREVRGEPKDPSGHKRGCGCDHQHGASSGGDTLPTPKTEEGAEYMATNGPKCCASRAPGGSRGPLCQHRRSCPFGRVRNQCEKSSRPAQNTGYVRGTNVAAAEPPYVDASSPPEEPTKGHAAASKAHGKPNQWGDHLTCRRHRRMRSLLRP